VGPGAHLKHLPSVETRIYCPQAFLSLDFQCRDDVSELNRRFGIEKSLPSQVSVQVAIVIEGEAHKGERHKVHDKGDQPEDSIPNRCGEACHVVSDLGVMLPISGRGFQVLNIILLQVIDAFAWWQSLHQAFTITCTGYRKLLGSASHTRMHAHMHARGR
jgi:hypothetical protein